MKLTRENLVQHLQSYQAELVGADLDEMKKDPFWYSNNTITPEQQEVFRNYAVNTIKRVLKCSQVYAEKQYSWFDLGYGFKLKEKSE